jgi:glutathionyl-hydroquinone reductase
MSEIEYFSFEDLDFLLKRDWFLTLQDIHDLLGYADDDTFWKIYSVRREYPQRVREIVAPLDYVHDKPLFKFTVRDLTDGHIEEMQKKDRAELRAMMQREWEQYMKNMPPRPPDSIDERINAQREAIEGVVEELREYKDVRKCGDRKKLAEFDKRIEQLWAQEAALQTIKQKTESEWLVGQRLKFEARL